MSIPTNAEILAILDRLDQRQCADDLESYWLDFKPFNDPKDDKKIAVEYAVCFANAEGGAVVFGVADRERGGRARAIHGSKLLRKWRTGRFSAPRGETSESALLSACSELAVGFLSVVERTTLAKV